MCIPRFIGEGYSKEFCKNMQKIKSQIAAENYELVDECDDLCAFCPNNINGICKDNNKVSQYDIKVRETLEKGGKPFPKDICTDCRWYYICSEF